MSDRDQPTEDHEISIGIEIPNSTPERFKYLIGRKNDKELFGMPPGSVTIERVRECVVKGTVEIQMTYRAGLPKAGVTP
jgi:hypothetical protein